MMEEPKVETKTNEIEAKVLKKYTYLEYEEYQIQIKNNTDAVILLDDLISDQTIKLIGDSGGAYTAYTNKLFKNRLKVNSGNAIILTIRFKKEASSNNKSKYIKFYKVIKNYDIYIQDTLKYKDTLEIRINV